MPEGWERKRISTYYSTCSGGTPSRTYEEYYESGIYPWVKTGEIKDCIIINTEEYITEEAVRRSSAKLLPPKSVAMAMYGVNIGQLGYFDKPMTCNQACCVFSDKRNFSSKHYLFYYLKSIREYGCYYLRGC
ncbi:MAG: restriction endonuclease subunit S [Oscillospiraceae bacterium]|nr:restriction endonuclease subunit S [Oscillospiraceae bacterium]MBR2977557.1 restriction endonuclease subunit S [Oscillospiraceae bacterium]